MAFNPVKIERFAGNNEIFKIYLVFVFVLSLKFCCALKASNASRIFSFILRA